MIDSKSRTLSEDGGFNWGEGRDIAEAEKAPR